jgi:hypothetical protein
MAHGVIGGDDTSTKFDAAGPDGVHRFRARKAIDNGDDVPAVALRAGGS